ncbi:MAG: ATP-binding protein [Kiloniellales bacterium]|nr:ATP-binding protein [Kiloniellales bacterium]
MSYRTKLLLAFGVLIGLTIGLTALSNWGGRLAQLHIERARLAHDVLEGHWRLSSHTYQLFKQLADALLIGDQDLGRGEADLERKLRADITDLREMIADEIAFVEEDEQKGERGELLTLSLLERQIDRVLVEFAEVRNLRNVGERGKAWIKLNAVLEQSIDGSFNALLAAAIAEEHREVKAADAKARALINRVNLIVDGLAALAIAVGILCAALLLSGLRRPMVALLAGTRALRKGDLTHRIELSGSDEFGELAHSFNRMAGELEAKNRDLEAAKADLEQAVTARTAELCDANAALEKADQVRRRFFADISHELRTPLTIIRGEAEIGLRGNDKAIDDYKGTLHRVLEQAEHTARLVDDLLFVARQNAGETRMSRQAIALREIVESVCGDAEVLAEKRGVTVTLRQEVEEAVVSGDPGRLRQLFLILIDNAIRYSEARGEVSLYMGAAPKGVVVRVSDGGIGIGPDELERIFERFYRGDNASEHHTEGTGLGLPVAKAIADAHDGELVIDSRLGEGTTASVFLPTVRKLRAVA